MIVYITPGGRLGNQLFQLAFLEGIRRPGEIAFCTGMGAVRRLAPGLRRVVNSDSFSVIKAFDRLLMPLLRRLVSLGIVSSIREGSHGSFPRVTETNGWLKRLRVVEGYFQDNRFCSETWRRTLSAALNPATLRDNRPPEGTAIFVHVRRTDYAQYHVLGDRPAMLPLSYYEEALSIMSREVPSPFYVFTGDDPDFIRSRFGRYQPQVVRHSSADADFALMTQCHGGILSNSSFCFWAAMLCKRTAPLIGPRFWLGWQTREWYPAGIETPLIRYISVSDS